MARSPRTTAKRSAAVFMFFRFLLSLYRFLLVLCFLYAFCFWFLYFLVD